MQLGAKMGFPSEHICMACESLCADEGSPTDAGELQLPTEPFLGRSRLCKAPILSVNFLDYGMSLFSL